MPSPIKPPIQPRVQQQANTFPIRPQVSRAQPTNQFRPTRLTASSLPSNLQGFANEIDTAFRQVFDLIHALRDAFGPIVLFVSGDPTGADVAVPVEADQLETGSSLGLQIQLTRVGTWVVSAAVSLKIVGDTDLFTLSLTLGSSTVPYSGQWKTGADQTVMLCQNWQITSQSGDEILTLWIKKASGAGTSKVTPVNSTMTATWQGN